MKILTNLILLTALFIVLLSFREKSISIDTMYICLTVLSCTNLIINTLFELKNK